MAARLHFRLHFVMFALTACLSLSITSCDGCNKNAGVVPESHYVKGPGQKKLIIFVHGIIGDMDNTWINQKTHASWPDLVARDSDLKDFDVYVYGYSSPPLGQASDIEEIAHRLGKQLKDGKVFANYAEVDFITHSMGGLITKRMLDTLNTPSESVNLHRVRCVIYISVPSNGAEVASLASWISRNPQFRSMSPKGAASFLQAVEGDWGAVLRARTPSAPFPLSFSAYEKVDTYNVPIVPRLFISQLGDDEPMAFDYNHIDIVKPATMGSDIYIWAKARILESSSHPVELPKSSIIGGHKILTDAFKDADHSGVRFLDGSTVSFFSGKADLMVSNTSPPQDVAQFFIQADEGRIYQDAPQDKGASGGILKMPEVKLDDVKECPPTCYTNHWFSVEERAIYCVMTRDGNHYAKVQVMSLQQDRITFDWVYQP